MVDIILLFQISGTHCRSYLTVLQTTRGPLQSPRPVVTMLATISARLVHRVDLGRIHYCPSFFLMSDLD